MPRNNYPQFDFSGILWDLDGTLIDQTEAIIRNFQAVVIAMGEPLPDPATIRRSLGMPMRGTMALFIEEGRLDAACAEFRRRFPEVMYDGLIVLPGALDCLELFSQHGLPQAVFTNKHGPTAREICEKLGFSRFLTKIIGNGDTSMNKPDPEYTLYVLGLLGLPAEASVLMIGDSPTDIAVAGGVGLTPWTVATGAHSCEELKLAGAANSFADLIGLKRFLRDGAR